MAKFPSWFEGVELAVQSYLPMWVEFTRITDEVVAVCDEGGPIGQVVKMEDKILLSIPNWNIQSVYKTYPL